MSGVDHLVQLAADELGASGARVDSIRPRLIRTDMVQTITDGGHHLRRGPDGVECCRSSPAPPDL